MSKKQWYQIEIECIKFNPSFDMKVGEKQVIGKVKSYGLAYAAANAIKDVYKDNCSVTIK